MAGAVLQSSKIVDVPQQPGNVRARGETRGVVLCCDQIAFAMCLLGSEWLVMQKVHALYSLLSCSELRCRRHTPRREVGLSVQALGLAIKTMARSAPRFAWVQPALLCCSSVVRFAGICLCADGRSRRWGVLARGNSPINLLFCCYLCPQCVMRVRRRMKAAFAGMYIVL